MNLPVYNRIAPNTLKIMKDHELLMKSFQGDVLFLPQHSAKLIASAPKFQTDFHNGEFESFLNEDDSLFQGENRIYTTPDEPVRFPYDTFWVEQGFGEISLGMFCAYREIYLHSDAGRTVFLYVLPFLSAAVIDKQVKPYSGTRPVPVFLLFDPIDQMVWVRHSLAGDVGPESFPPELRLQWDSVLQVLVDRCLTMLNYFLKLFNCKNIEVQDVVPSKSQQKRRKQVKPLISYKTLVISPGSKSKKNANRPHQGGENRVHLCRGHFKTYTEDAPLLGHGVGTYWWAPMARGSRKKGVVHKDYKIKGEPK